MNFGNLALEFQSESVKSENDLSKLINICNSYGLNKEQTEQLIEQFKKGAFCQSEQSFNDSLNNTISQMTFSEKNEREEYSFKHQQEQMRGREQFHRKDWIDASDSKMEHREQESHLSEYEELQPVQKMLHDKFMADKDLIASLQEQNKKLKCNLDEKDSKIHDLLQMKRQDTDIILGLKDIITGLTQSIQQKDSSFREINQKYSNLIESKVRELSEAKSYSQLESGGLQDITNSTFGPRHLRNSCKTNHNQTYAKQSQDSEPGESKVTNTSSLFEGKARKSSRIDIQKYKEMIENMRNNY